jgi:hypothetical protein
VIKHGIPPGATVHALGRGGREYAIYVSGGSGTARLQLALPAGRYRAQWFDPKTGQTTKRTLVRNGGGTVTLISPLYSEDVALAIRSVKG